MRIQYRLIDRSSESKLLRYSARNLVTAGLAERQAVARQSLCLKFS